MVSWVVGVVSSVLQGAESEGGLLIQRGRAEARLADSFESAVLHSQ